MNKVEDFENIPLKNNNNKYILDEFIRYYMYIYSNYENSDKSSKENYYKLLTIKKIIDIISKFKNDIISGNQFEIIRGIGPKTISRINEIIDTGKLSEIKENKSISAVKELASIYGIGPSKASFYYENFKIKSIKDLLKADKKGLIKLSNQMKLGIKYKDVLNENIPRILIENLDIFIHKIINKFDKKFNITICGSYRRKKNTSSDIDILITHPDIKKINGIFNSHKYLESIINLFSNYFIIDKLTEKFNTLCD
jgi:DNA polymerase/3'-5' exonuclease PolX